MPSTNKTLRTQMQKCTAFEVRIKLSGVPMSPQGPTREFDETRGADHVLNLATCIAMSLAEKIKQYSTAHAQCGAAQTSLKCNKGLACCGEKFFSVDGQQFIY